jgi:membrane-bound lytic murein transglycosylase A
LLQIISFGVKLAPIMKKIYVYTTLFLLVLASGVVWHFWPRPIAVKPTPFSKLKGWEHTDFRKSLDTFKISCRIFVKQSPSKDVGTEQFKLTVNDWLPACRAALAKENYTSQEAKSFFEQWFSPVGFHQGKPIDGLFTGYYLPLLQGSLNKSKEFSVPVYGPPDNLITVDLGSFDPSLKTHKKIKGRVHGRKLVPYYTRKEIKNGALQHHAPVVAWIHDEVDRQFLEIEGSGIIELDNGKKMYVGYEDQNGAAYTPIANVLIKKGVMTKDSASMQAIRSYLKKHPKEVDAVLNQNKSFVFFRELNDNAAYGTQGAPLTPGYSLAVDTNWIPLGAPIWLNTTRPTQKPEKVVPFERLMIAQDTGGAIKGVVRGDVYWGGGEAATYISGHMKNPGRYWLLLPKQLA